MKKNTILCLISIWIGLSPALASSLYGTLTNFDIFNETGGECHGFEIELDGLTSKDVTSYFGAPYERYGDPKLEDFSGGVYVRYESPWDPVLKVFTATTPVPLSITPTAGHQCWTGGSAGYQTSGCEHFGLSLARNATKVVYRWLTTDPLNAGHLQPSGTDISLPAPIWMGIPPLPAVTNQPAAPAQIRAIVPGPQPAPQFEFGDAMWVKVYKTETPSKAELNHLVTDDPAVPQKAAEVETEWTILQSSPNKAGEGELDNGGAPNDASKSVTRRYEFYKYTGGYDPETHEALCSCDAPAPGELGDYIGSQMVAANLVKADQILAVQVTTDSLLYSRVTRTWTGNVTVTNTGNNSIQGPVQISFSDLSNGTAALNATGSFQGYPYLTIPGLESANTSLPANQSVIVPVQFGGQYAVAFKALIFSGSLLQQ